MYVFDFFVVAVVFGKCSVYSIKSVLSHLMCLEYLDGLDVLLSLICLLYCSCSCDVLLLLLYLDRVFSFTFTHLHSLHPRYSNCDPHPGCQS